MNDSLTLNLLVLQIYACSIAMALAIGDPNVFALNVIALVVGTAWGLAKSGTRGTLICNYIPRTVPLSEGRPRTNVSSLPKAA